MIFSVEKKFKLIGRTLFYVRESERNVTNEICKHVKLMIIKYSRRRLVLTIDRRNNRTEGWDMRLTPSRKLAKVGTWS
ncbi:MAG: hypothetical protein ACTS6G_00455 [Candidatus Hodgkinia cicadicola]